MIHEGEPYLGTEPSSPIKQPELQSGLLTLKEYTTFSTVNKIRPFFEAKLGLSGSMM